VLLAKSVEQLYDKQGVLRTKSCSMIVEYFPISCVVDEWVTIPETALFAVSARMRCEDRHEIHQPRI
jgi:hypothetical protein